MDIKFVIYKYGFTLAGLNPTLHETQKEHQKFSQNQSANGTGCKVQVDVECLLETFSDLA